MLCLLGCATSCLWGQAATGTVTGVVTDEQGAVIPAAGRGSRIGWIPERPAMPAVGHDTRISVG